MKRDFAFKATTLLLAGTLGGVLLTQAACKKSGPDIKIGVIAELTGDIPAVGDSCKKAAELAVAEINDAGGVEVAGTKHLLRLVIEDSQGAAAAGRRGRPPPHRAGERPRRSSARTPASAPSRPRRRPRRGRRSSSPPGPPPRA